MSATVESVAADHRAELVGLAYRVLGSVADAEDAVQEALLRLERHGLDGIERPGAWLSRVTARICLDRLREARTRREVYVGPWLPEPVVTDAAADAAAPLELAESVTMAFLVVLESLGPAERVAFVLHDVFGYGYDELATVLDRSEVACRQLVSRARGHVQARRPRFDTDLSTREEVTTRFLAACGTGELAPLLELLAPDVVLRSDGGGVVAAARKLIHGADRVARFLVGTLTRVPPDITVEILELNGGPGIVGRRRDGTVDTVFVLDVAEGLVVGINAVRNPEKLRHLARTRPA